MKIAVTGATGQLGRLVIENLKTEAASDDIIALARDPQKAADMGVPARAFDYDEADQLAPALKGVDTLLLISGVDIGRRLAQHTAVIEAAKEASVGHIVYTSLLNADKTTIALGPEHAGTEKALAASGVPHTILRNGWYTENYTMALPSPQQKSCWIHRCKASPMSLLVMTALHWRKWLRPCLYRSGILFPTSTCRFRT